MTLLTLVRPSLHYVDEIRAYRTEYLTTDTRINGSGDLHRYDDPLDWIAARAAAADQLTAPDDWGPIDGWMSVDDAGRIIGLVSIRRELRTDYAKEYVGHIGYSIRPGERGKGYGKFQLLLALDKCRELGLHRVLVTCAADNEASRRTIMTCGGVFERVTLKTIDGENTAYERYWIPLRQSSTGTDTDADNVDAHEVSGDPLNPNWPAPSRRRLSDVSDQGQH